jgi:putative Mg2+ transporter-C (MgtC) family protein
MISHDLSVADALLRLAISFALALPLGWDGERRSRAAGLRTYPLLSVGACAFLVIAQELGADPRARADALYGLLTGIGFVGTGAIVRSPDASRGMSTAVSLWVTGAIGAGVACGAPWISASAAVLTMVALRAPWPRAQRKGA